MIDVLDEGDDIHRWMEDNPKLAAAIKMHMRTEEPKTVLEMLKEAGQLSPSGMEKDPRRAAASQMVGAPGGVQYAAYNPTGRLDETASFIGNLIKLKAAAGGAGGAGG